MAVVGVGIGLVMQVLVLAVQNDAPARNIGVATSTATFFRSMGGSLGVAIFGAIFASRLASELASIPGAGGLSGGANIRPDQVHALPPAVRHDFLLAFVDALQPVFLVGAGFTAVAFVLALTAARGAAAQDDGRGRRSRRSRGDTGSASSGGPVGEWPRRLRSTSPGSRSRAGVRSSASTT